MNSKDLGHCVESKCPPLVYAGRVVLSVMLFYDNPNNVKTKIGQKFLMSLKITMKKFGSTCSRKYYQDNRIWAITMRKGD